MKIYIIQELGYEYNDEFYSRPECEGGTPIKAFRSEEKAMAAAFRMTKERLKASDMESEAGPIANFYDVIGIEVSDEEVS